ncbi:ectonucleotide pyrophosphatase/phosphodiesterase family member 5 [Halyomorpha halys]|uniref:ectonucleotide pyrophosphatase/phosphodiesterase family member 5 n=1 Tax=Halyomorpha halys TaxID=286706 RepID=UPI0006D5146D|nr:ectonucleotide pyrophosphatase/phosphodiesterase family member 5-like [Halyomorpha halys]
MDEILSAMKNLLTPVLFSYSLYTLISQSSSKSSYDKLLIISYDGFRYDYLDRELTPYLFSLKSSSTYAKHVINVFPTQTFVNHFSIATGLYSGVHGVIGNVVFNPKTGKLMTYGYDLFHYNKDITPIWTLNEKAGQGRHSGVMMWPGSQFAYAGISPTFVNIFDPRTPWENRISTAISWFLHPKTPANLVMMYFEEPDDEEHTSGPGSLQTRERLKKVDKLTEYLFKSLKDNSLADVNVVLLSDHGMESVTFDRMIDLTKIAGDKAVMYGTSPVLQIFPNKGQSVPNIYTKLNDAAAKNKHFKVYLKENIPEHFYIKDCERTAPILAVAEPTYAFQDYYEAIDWQIKNKGAPRNGTYGIHGYDPESINMRPYFIAHGPMFKENFNAGELRMVDMHPLFANILRLELPSLKPNGTLAGVQKILKPKNK